MNYTNLSKNLFFSLLLSVSSLLCAKNADLVIFSFDRPLQLYALLESVDKYVSGVEDVYIVYRASNPAYDAGYEEVKQTFPAHYLKQGSNPKADFKPLTLQASFNSKSEYIIFAVDDIIVKDTIDLSHDIDLLELTKAYGFYYRLGTNLTKCYAYNDRNQPVPPLKEVEPDVFAWVIRTGSCDWGYPHSVDMTLLRKREIKDDFYSMSYYHPNTLEANWAGRAGKIRNRFGLCYRQSKIVNLPLNRVQHSHTNRNMEIPANELLEIFQQGGKIDINCVYQIDNKSAHWPIIPDYIAR